MVQHICTVCGFVHDGDTLPESCPQCSAPQALFKIYGDKQKNVLADEHRVGVAKGVDGGVINNLRMEFASECAEIATYLAMGRQADREGYPEIGDTFRRIALEEADHAARFAELLGEVLSPNTLGNLQRRATAEFQSCANKKKLSTTSKQLNLDAIHDTVHEMAKDEGRHYQMLQGMLKRYFDEQV